VRLAGCALLALAPIASACTLGWSSRPTRIVACSISDTLVKAEGTDEWNTPPEQRCWKVDGRGPSTSSADAVVFSIDPAAAARGAEPAVPVIFPGYVLPDDSLEDQSHEGG
jgi:hypothetical protein